MNEAITNQRQVGVRKDGHAGEINGEVVHVDVDAG